MSRKIYPPRPHYPISLWSMARVTLWWCYEILGNLPRLLSLRKFYRQRSLNRSRPTVALLGDNLDEVNGIAINSRSLVRAMRRLGHPVYLIGVAFHTKNPRMETGERGSIFMVPGRCSMDQPGYEGSETAVPQLRLLLRLLRRYPVDLFEIETPNTVGHMVVLVSRIIGIKTLHHYRTDIPAYGRLLVKNPLGRWLIPWLVSNFTRVAGPVIVPSQFFKRKVAEMGKPESEINVLPRGVDLTHFHPDKKDLGHWEAYGNPHPGTRFLFVGRVSREKNIELIAEAFPAILKKFPDCSLTVVGSGPSLEEMQTLFRNEKRVTFTGMLQGQKLACIYASADIFLFPSTTDTFGNTVLEAMASGLACIVSDQGGPQEIIEKGVSGYVFQSEKPGDFTAKMEILLNDPPKIERFKKAARQRALGFTFENSAKHFYAFYQQALA